jgi:hypothetical protein
MIIAKKMLWILMAASMLTVYSAAASFASITCDAATIDQAAVVEDDGDATTAPYQVRATCAGKWSGSTVFDMSTDLGEGGYATILTALSLGNTVKMQVAGPGWHSLIERVYLNKTTP